MNKQMFLLFSHKLTEEQERDAIEGLGVRRFIYLPEPLQKKWSNVPPDAIEISSHLKEIMEFIWTNGKRGDYVLIQGDFGAVVKMVEFSRAIGLKPIYATTRRVVEEKEENGEVIKISRFKHVRFREYE